MSWQDIEVLCAVVVASCCSQGGVRAQRQGMARMVCGGPLHLLVGVAEDI